MYRYIDGDRYIYIYIYIGLTRCFPLPVRFLIACCSPTGPVSRLCAGLLGPAAARRLFTLRVFLFCFVLRSQPLSPLPHHALCSPTGTGLPRVLFSYRSCFAY